MGIPYTFLFIVAIGLASSFLTMLLLGHYKKIGIVDTPNQRSSHQTPTVTGGGLAIVVILGICAFVGFLFDILSLHLTLFLSTSFVLALVGWVDDHQGLSARFRLAVQVILSLPLSYFLLQCFTAVLPVEHWLLGIPILAFFLVWFVNLFNFMDGIDGLAAIEVISVVAGILLIINISSSGGALLGDEFLPLWLLLASVMGFLVFNFPRARIFLGDVGSLFLGWTLALFAIWYSVQGYTNLWSWWILMGVFIVDASLMLLVKLLRKQHLFEAHKSHIYQQLAEHYGSHVRVTLGVLMVNGCWLLPWAYLAHHYSAWGGVILLVSWLPLIIIAIAIHRGRGGKQVRPAA